MTNQREQMEQMSLAMLIEAVAELFEMSHEAAEDKFKNYCANHPEISTTEAIAALHGVIALEREALTDDIDD